MAKTAQAPGGADQFGALESNWRRVASTHTLHDLLNADKPRQSKGPDWKLVALGLVLVLAGVSTFCAGTFAMVIAPLLPPSANPFVKAVQLDKYYHLLIPLSVPVTIFAIFLNWLSMKLFKHNS